MFIFLILYSFVKILFYKYKYNDISMCSKNFNVGIFLKKVILIKRIFLRFYIFVVDILNLIWILIIFKLYNLYKSRIIIEIVLVCLLIFYS